MTPGAIEVMLPVSVGPESIALLLGFGLLVLILWAASAVLGPATSVPTPLMSVIVVALCVGNILGSSWVAGRSQRRRWARVVGHQPSSEMVLALTPSALVIWDERRFRQGRPALIAQARRVDVAAEPWPAWAAVGVALKVFVAGRGSISLSLHGPPSRKAVERLLMALDAPTATA